MPDTTAIEVATSIVRRTIGQFGPIYTLTAYGRGETDHVRIFGVRDGGIVEITGHVAYAFGWKVKPGAGIAYGGGGYSKGLAAAEDACRVIGRKLDQSTWHTL